MAKAKLQFGTSKISLDGSESFVEKQLERFIEKFSGKQDLDSTAPPPAAYDSGKPKQTPIKPTNKTAKKKPAAKKAAAKSNVQPIDFEISADGKTPSLKDFMGDKKPNINSSPEVITAIGYYMTFIRNYDQFEEGHVEFAYIRLGYKRITNFPEAFRNIRTRKKYLKKSDDGNGWVLTKLGELFVHDDLPRTMNEG